MVVHWRRCVFGVEFVQRNYRQRVDVWFRRESLTGYVDFVMSSRINYEIAGHNSVDIFCARTTDES